MFKNHNVIFLVFLSLCINSFANGQVNNASWKEEDKIYAKVYDAALKGQNIKNGSLSKFAHQNPTILALVFTRCSGICNPFLLQLKEKMQFENNKKSFKILVISFDPRDTQADMNLMARRFGLEKDKKWVFAVTDSINKLNNSIGFNPKWNYQKQQYDHDALLVGVNSDGFITKKLVGLRNEHDLALLVSSINNEFSPTYKIANKNMLFSCFNYNTITGKNTPGLGLLFLALPAIITILLILFVNLFVRSRRT